MATVSQLPSPPGTTRAGMLFDEFAVDALFTALTGAPDPDLLLQERGVSRSELRKLESDPEIAAALDTRRDALIGTPWRLEPAAGQAPDERHEWLWAELAPHMDALLRAAFAAVPYGYSVAELVYRRAGGRIGVARASEKPVEWFRLGASGELLYCGPTQSAGFGPGQALDTDYKFLLARRNPSYRNPYGEALLSRLYWPWFFRHNAWRFWMQFLERFGTPLLLGQTANPAAFVAAVQQLGIDAVVGVGIEEKVQAVTQAAPGEFERVDRAIAGQIQKLILGQTLTSEVDGKGSYAAAKVHNEVREDKRIADIRLVSGTLQHLVNALWTLNRFPGAPPTFVLADGRGLESARAERDAKLVQAKILTLGEDYLLRTYDFEPGDFTLPPTVEIRLDAEPEVLPDAAPLNAAQPAALPLELRPKALERLNPANRFTVAQQRVEALAERVLDDAESPIAPRALHAAIRAATSPEDLADRLAILATEADTEAFQALLSRALFAADVLGYCNATAEHGPADDPDGPDAEPRPAPPATLPGPGLLAEPVPDPLREREMALREQEAAIRAQTLRLLEAPP